MANGNKVKKVVKGRTKMSNKPDYEGINFKNKAIDRISDEAQNIQKRQSSLFLIGAVGKGGSRNR
tara:strand:+ start:2946 stop:3140 length:195 start_codon:yes stop_codon:yes gene_type:complete